MIKAKDVMNTNVVPVDPDDTIEEVMSTMIRLGISGLPVVDMAGQLLGIITEFDLLELVWNPNTSKNKVYHYMTRDVRTVDEEDRTDRCSGSVPHALHPASSGYGRRSSRGNHQPPRPDLVCTEASRAVAGTTSG